MKEEIISLNAELRREEKHLDIGTSRFMKCKLLVHTFLKTRKVVIRRKKKSFIRNTDARGE